MGVYKVYSLLVKGLMECVLQSRCIIRENHSMYIKFKDYISAMYAYISDTKRGDDVFFLAEDFKLSFALFVCPDAK